MGFCCKSVAATKEFKALLLTAASAERKPATQDSQYSQYSQYSQNSENSQCSQNSQSKKD